MEYIKTIAEKILLLLYIRKRGDEALLKTTTIEFSGINENNPVLKNDSELTNRILEITDQSSLDAYTALKYLQEKRLLAFKEDRTEVAGSENFIAFHSLVVTAEGVDAIEGRLEKKSE